MIKCTTTVKLITVTAFDHFEKQMVKKPLRLDSSGEGTGKGFCDVPCSGSNWDKILSEKKKKRKRKQGKKKETSG